MAGRFKASFIITLIEDSAFFFANGVWITLAIDGHPVLGAILGLVIWHVFTNIEHYVAIVPPGYRPDQ